MPARRTRVSIRAASSSPARRARPSRAPGRLGRRRWAARARTRPPARVRPRPSRVRGPRRMKRWPGSTATSRSRWSWARPRPPGASCRSSRRTRVASAWPVPRWSSRARRWRRGRSRVGSASRLTSRRRPVARAPGETRTWPRLTRVLLDAREVGGGALAGPGGVGGLAVDLHPPHPEPRAAGGQLDLVLRGHRPGEQGAGDHGAEALEGEGPVHRQEERAVGGALIESRPPPPPGRPGGRRGPRRSGRSPPPPPPPRGRSPAPCRRRRRGPGPPSPAPGPRGGRSW